MGGERKNKTDKGRRKREEMGGETERTKRREIEREEISIGKRGKRRKRKRVGR